MRAWDQYTMQHEPVSSIDLMERAAKKCTDWIIARGLKERSFKIFCGKGNNGGDGLAIARMLLQNGYSLSVHIPESENSGSEDFQTNLLRLQQSDLNAVHWIRSQEDLPFVHSRDIVIDALYGSGLNKPLQGLAASLVEQINRSGAMVISIDVPSGLFMDSSSIGHPIVEADHTLSFQCYKTALLVQENASYIGTVAVLDIGLDSGFLQSENSDMHFVDKGMIHQLYKPRDPFAHKGNFGHALLIAGSYGKMGAAILAARSCLRSGAGLLSCYLPHCGYQIMQTAVPEAMVLTDENENIIARLPDEIEKYSVIGIGPGIGTADETQKLLSFIVRRYQRPLVIDADGLNCLSLQKDLLPLLPSGSVLTPHPKEFERLFGAHTDDFERIGTASKKAREQNTVIILKGHHTLIATPRGKLFFNSTGNAGMAKGGSGDVLTGIVTALLAQKYGPEQAAILAVYLHGSAGDLAAAALSQEAMTATDIISFLPQAFLALSS
jgi:hydroxyethylthiazole kinase-like uncharacterized protein yjeF